MNTAYKHLDTKLHIGDLTLGQWVGLAAGTIGALLYGMYLSPFGQMLTLVSAIYLGGIPIAAVFLASLSEFDFLLLVRSAVRWHRRDARYLPGPGMPTPGYRLFEAAEDVRRAERDRIAELDPTTLWGES
jgi:hypothetical protein